MHRVGCQIKKLLKYFKVPLLIFMLSFGPSIAISKKAKRIKKKVELCIQQEGRPMISSTGVFEVCVEGKPVKLKVH